MLVTARKFPGIDETKLDAVAAPVAIEATPRRWTAPEMIENLDGAGEATPSPVETAEAAARADLGVIRQRAGLADTES